MPPKAPSTINALWPHYLSAAAIVLALVVGVLRVVFMGKEFLITLRPRRLISRIVDWSDPYHCGSLLTEGQWLDDQFKNWQPEGACHVDPGLRHYSHHCRLHDA